MQLKIIVSFQHVLLALTRFQTSCSVNEFCLLNYKQNIRLTELEFLSFITPNGTK